MASPALLLAPLAMFMLVASITPGPNNLMLLSSGVRFGFNRTVPHLLGIVGGMALLLLVAYAGAAGLMLALPWIGQAMTLACCAYLLWLAGAMLRVEAPRNGGEPAAAAQPLRASEAVLFQFVNPKAWAMAVAACTMAGKLPLPETAKLGTLLLVCSIVNLPCVSLWALFGKSMRRHLDSPRVRQAFNGAMAALLLATALWMLWPLLAGIHLPATQDGPLLDPAVALGR